MAKKSDKTNKFSLADTETANSLFDIIPDAVIIHDGKEILFCNPAAITMYKAGSIDELIGLSPDELVHPDDLEWLKERRKQTSKPGKKAPPQETRRLCLDGTSFYAENTSTGIMYNDRPAFMILSRDVTERQTADKALQLSKERYGNVINSQAELITVFTPDGKITLANQAYCDFSGMSSDELLGTSIYDAVPDHELKALKEFFSSFSIEKSNQTFENQLISADGAVHDYEWSNSVSFDENNNIREIQSVGRDVTKQRELERLKSEFIALVSHELRTPLTSIMGVLSLSLGGALGQLPEKLQEMLIIAKANAEKLSGLINDILDFEKLRSGGMEYHFTEIDLTELVAHAININQVYAEQCNVTFKYIKPEESIYVRGDNARLEQVVANLLSNAAKFSTPGESVDILVTKNMTIGRVEVRDTGQGIPTEFKEKIFDQFSQADSTDERAVQGTGLGLSISKSIIEKHEGIIDFTSTLGIGTAFFFEIPLLNKSKN